MTDRPGERVELVAAETDRLDFVDDDPPTPPAHVGGARLAFTGILTLAAGISALWIAGFAQDQFARAAWLGWTTVAVGIAGFGLLGTALAREVGGLIRLGRVDRLREDLASGDGRRIARAARVWALQTGQEALLPAIDAMNDPDAILALLRAGPAEAMRRRADALGRSAARQMAAALAVVPAPGLVVALVAWRGVRLVRDVAALYGARPGGFGTISLLRRTAVSASMVGSAEFAANAAAHALLTNPILAHALGDVAGAGVAARRMLVLARVASAACDPTAPGPRGRA